jgi:hypothetical protein
VAAAAKWTEKVGKHGGAGGREEERRRVVGIRRRGWDI